jgi:hypothetical protein
MPSADAIASRFGDGLEIAVAPKRRRSSRDKATPRGCRDVDIFLVQVGFVDEA